MFHYFRTVLFLSIFVALGPLATDLYLPSLPTISRVFATENTNVQLTLSIYFVGFAIGQLVYGPLSDRFGRKPILQIGMLLFIATSALAVFAQSIEGLIIIRFFQAIGGCAGPVLGRAIVRDLYEPPEARRVLSYVASTMALAPAVAPIFGSYITVLYGWQANFWFLMGCGTIAFAVLCFAIPESNKYKNPEATKILHLCRNYYQLILQPVWLLNTLTCSFIFAGLFAFLSGSSFVLIEFFSVSEQSYAYLFAIVVLGFIIGSQLSARLVRYYEERLLIRYGCALGAIAGVAMLIFSLISWHQIIWIIAPQFFFMMAVGIVMPLTLAGALASFPHMAGTASALFGTMQMLIASLLGYFIGLFHTGTPTVMALGIALAGIVAFVCIILLETFTNQSAEK